MKRPHLLAVEASDEELRPLFEASEKAGLRLGLLQLAEPAKSLIPEAVGPGGLLRSVVVGAAWTVASKPRRGEPVLEDIVREYFLGAAAVLIRGKDHFPGLELPRLCGDSGAWLLTTVKSRKLDTQAVVARLRRRKQLSL